MYTVRKREREREEGGAHSVFSFFQVDQVRGEELD